MDSATESNDGGALDAARGATANNPGRTALIALGIGVMIGRASKR